MPRTQAGEFWTPHRVQHYQDYLQPGLPQSVFVNYRRAYIRNIAYAFQYLQYLECCLREDDLHAVIAMQLKKTFVVTGCGIVESVLWMLLKGSNSQKTTEWKELRSPETNSFADGQNTFKFQVRQFEKLPQPVDIEMKFVDMCQRAEQKKVLGISSDVYARIPHLRRLRNRVHLHSVQHDRDNDWWKIRRRDVETMKDVLRSILKASIFSPFPDYDRLFSWLDAPPPEASTTGTPGLNTDRD